MWKQSNNPYSTEKTSRHLQRFAAGSVVSYDPDKRFYVVSVDGKGDTNVKQLDTGILRPYGVGTRVIAGYVPGSEWFIVGEIPQPAAPPEITADSEEETLARGRARLQNANFASNDGVPSYRTIDPAGESAPPVFSGDARIENRTERNVTRSFLQVFSFGDILMRARAFCYIHLVKAKSTIIMRGRNLIQGLVGYRKTVDTPAEGVRENRSTVTEEYRADPLADSADIIMRTGDLTGLSDKLILGSETTFAEGFTHLDLTNGTARTKIGDSFFLHGSLVNSVPAGDLGLPADKSGEGFSLQTPTHNITLAESGIVDIERNDGNMRIRLDNDNVSITNGSESIQMSSSSTSVSSSSLDISSSGNVNISAGGAMTLNGSTIDLN